jgi:hypothetical protein
MRATELVVLVRCLHCRHKSVLNHHMLAGFGFKPDAPIAAFIKRLRCTKCGSGSVMANRVAPNKRAARGQMYG